MALSQCFCPSLTLTCVCIPDQDSVNEAAESLSPSPGSDHVFAAGRLTVYSELSLFVSSPLSSFICLGSCAFLCSFSISSTLSFWFISSRFHIAFGHPMILVLLWQETIMFSPIVRFQLCVRRLGRPCHNAPMHKVYERTTKIVEMIQNFSRH